jgi:lipopolysaccharide export system protein LptA
MIKRTISIILAAGLACSSAWARLGDRDQPINIAADSLEIDDQRGMSVYRGSVQYDQGSMHLEADVATLYSEQRQVKNFIATGQPARYSQLTDTEGVEIRAEADEIEYTAETERVVFRGNAHLWRGGDEFAGKLIEYDARNDVVSARGDESGGQGRVQVVIQPRRETEQSPGAPQSPQPEVPQTESPQKIDSGQ